MSNAMYPLSRQAWADGNLSWSSDDWRAILLDDTYAYSEAHEFLDDVTSAQIAVSGNLTGKTNVEGICDADDVIFPAVAAGDTVSAIVVYQWTGDPATSRVAIFYDTLATAELIDFDTDSGDVIVRWSNGPTKMFRL